MTRRITDDELARRIMEDALPEAHHYVHATSAYYIADYLGDEPGNHRESTVLLRLRALRDEGRVVEVAGPRGSLWRLP